MSTYYDYREVKVMIAHKLMSMEGWKVYGYKEDESDSMTDYYSPAYWEGVAEKNGYILCVDVYGSSEGREIKQYSGNNEYNNSNIMSKIEQLKNFTTDRGATEAEEATAKAKIKLFEQKMQEEQEENNNKYIVVGRIPSHQAHPSKCNWHIEKDGIIIAKGNGILKYSNIYNYYTYSQYEKDLNEYKKNKNKYYENHVNDLINRNCYYTKEQAEESAKCHMEELEKDIKLIEQFENLINKFDTTCGCLVGEGEIEQLEKIIVTEYKTELKAVETTNGSIKEGQCFILKTDFNYNRYKGLVYRIHETEYNGKKYYNAYKLNGKLTKECTGRASSNNSWSYIEEKFLKWIEKGSIAWCELQEVKTPYEVEKFIKKTLNNNKNTDNNKNEKQAEQAEQNEESKNNVNIEFDITQSKHTKTNADIWLVKIKDSLSKDEFAEIRKKFATLKGYYSTFTHSFIFNYDPTEKLVNVA